MDEYNMPHLAKNANLSQVIEQIQISTVHRHEIAWDMNSFVLMVIRNLWRLGNSSRERIQKPVGPPTGFKSGSWREDVFLPPGALINGRARGLDVTGDDNLS